MPLALPSPLPIIDHVQDLIRLGTRWEARGLDPRTGAGCYGFVHYVYGLMGITLPERAEEAEDCFTPVDPPLQPFDVVLRQPGQMLEVRHLGILLLPPIGYHMADAASGLARFSLRHCFWKKHPLVYWRHKGFACIS